jgi:hypothetical protein
MCFMFEVARFYQKLAIGEKIVNRSVPSFPTFFFSFAYIALDLSITVL